MHTCIHAYMHTCIHAVVVVVVDGCLVVVVVVVVAVPATATAAAAAAAATATATAATDCTRRARLSARFFGTFCGPILGMKNEPESGTQKLSPHIGETTFEPHFRGQIPSPKSGRKTGKQHAVRRAIRCFAACVGTVIQIWTKSVVLYRKSVDKTQCIRTALKT